MKQAVLIEEIQVDEMLQLHITVPAEMGQRFKVFVLPLDAVQSLDAQDRTMMAAMMDESGFAKNVLSSSEEDVWNDL